MSQPRTEAAVKRLLLSLPLLVFSVAGGACKSGNMGGGDGGRADTATDRQGDAPDAASDTHAADAGTGGAGAATGGAGGSAGQAATGGEPGGAGGVGGHSASGGGGGIPLGTGGAPAGGAGGTATGGMGGGPVVSTCVPGTWTVDTVPTNQAPPGTPLGSTMDNTGHVYRVWFYEQTSTGPRNPAWPYKRNHVIQSRAPYGAWTTFDLMQDGDLSFAWFGANPLAVFGSSPLLLYADGAGVEAFAQRPTAFSATGGGDQTLRRPPLTWPADLAHAGGSVVFDPASGDRYAIKGSFATGGKGLLGISTTAGGVAFPSNGRNPQLDIDAAKGLYVLYLDDDTQATTLGVKAVADTMWTFVAGPTGTLLVKPDGTATVLGAGPSASGLVMNQRKAGTWMPTTIDAAGTVGVDGVDVKGSIHVAYSTGTALRYARVTAEGVLTTEAVAGSSAAPTAVGVDASGVVRIFDGRVVYRRCTVDANFPVDASLTQATWLGGPPSPVRFRSYQSGPQVRYDSRAVYDPARGRVVVALYDNTASGIPGPATWEWDGVAGTWTKRSDTGPSTSLITWFEAAYDMGSARVMAAHADGTFAYDGTTGTWTKLSASTAPGALFYDGTSAALVAVDSTAISRWDAATKTWTPGPNTGASLVAGTSLAADLGRQRILAYNSSDWKTIWEWSASAGWTARTTTSTTVPSTPGELVYAGNGQMASIDADGRTWLWNTTTAAWTKTNAGPSYRLPSGSAYAGGNRVLRYGFSGALGAIYNDPPPTWVYVAYVTTQLNVGP